ncbi:MAG: hypothetical protein U0V70_15585 [Terriglobia bacterium]
MSDQALLDEAMKIALDRLNNFPGCWDNIFPGLKAKGKTPEQLVKDPRIKIGMGSVPYPGWTRGTGGLATRNRYYSTYKGAEITFNIDPKKGDVFSSYIYSNFGVPSLSLLNSIALLAIHELGHAAALLYGTSVTTIVFENRPGVDPWVMDRQSVANDDNVLKIVSNRRRNEKSSYRIVYFFLPGDPRVSVGKTPIESEKNIQWDLDLSGLSMNKMAGFPALVESSVPMMAGRIGNGSLQ